MKNPINAFKNASMHTKVFWIVTLGIALLTTALCVYPYIWFEFHRSGKEYAND